MICYCERQFSGIEKWALLPPKKEKSILFQQHSQQIKPFYFVTIVNVPLKLYHLFDSFRLFIYFTSAKYFSWLNKHASPIVASIAFAIANRKR